MAASTALVTRVRGAVSRVFSPRSKQAFPGGGYLLPLGDGYIPSDWPWNFWQLGYDPLRTGGGAIVYACVAAYAQTIAMLPGTHWRSTNDGGRERVKNSALSRILKTPNGYQSISDFLLNLTGSLYDDGNAYAVALRNQRFEIAELHLMDSRTSAPRIGANGEIFYNLAGNPVIDKIIPRELAAAMPARDVLHIRLDARNRNNPLLGEPPLTSAMLDVAASNMMVQQALTFTANQAKPSGIIQTDLELKEAQRDDLRADWKKHTTGANAGGTPILTHGLKWQQVSTTSRDAQLAEMLQITDGRIATAYRVPLQLLSLFGVSGTPQGSVENLMRFWISTSLGFAVNHIEEAIGRFFGLAGQPDEYLELDTAYLERSNMLDRIEALARGVQGGIYAPNEARAREDLPRAKDGDEPRVQVQVVPLSFGAKQPVPPTMPAAPAAPGANAPTPPADNAPAAPSGNAPNGNREFAASILAAADRYGHRDAA
jgi:HK97 family phage portal protein